MLFTTIWICTLGRLFYGCAGAILATNHHCWCLRMFATDMLIKAKVAAAEIGSLGCTVTCVFGILVMLNPTGFSGMEANPPQSPAAYWTASRSFKLDRQSLQQCLLCLEVAPSSGSSALRRKCALPTDWLFRQQRPVHLGATAPSSSSLAALVASALPIGSGRVCSHWVLAWLWCLLQQQCLEVWLLAEPRSCWSSVQFIVMVSAGLTFHPTCIKNMVFDANGYPWQVVSPPSMSDVARAASRSSRVCCRFFASLDLMKFSASALGMSKAPVPTNCLYFGPWDLQAIVVKAAWLHNAAGLCSTS